MSSKNLTKQPREIVDVEVDFSRYFRGIDDYLVGADLYISGDDSDLEGGGGGHSEVELVGSESTSALVWLSGGTEGAIYKVEVLFTTNEGRKIEVDFFVRIRD